MENKKITPGDVTVVTNSHALDLPIADLIDELRKTNPDAKIEATYLKDAHRDGLHLWNVTLQAPAVNLGDALKMPGLTIIDVAIKRTGRFAKTMLFVVVGEPTLPTADQQHQAIRKRMDVDALMAIGLKRPGPDRPEQGDQILIGIEDNGLAPAELLGLAERLVDQTNEAFADAGNSLRFSLVPSRTEDTVEDTESLILPKPKSIITSIR